MEQEIWKDIPNYIKLYQVSSFGRIKSIMKVNEKVLTQTKSKNGYLTVGLTKEQKTKTFNVHSLVAMVFLGHKSNGHKIVTDHIDNNKLNNRADNLQLITTRENTSKDRKGGYSEYIGVSYDKKYKKYISSIYYNGNRINLGYFKIEIDAANAYKKALDLLNKGKDLNVIYKKNTEVTNDTK